MVQSWLPGQADDNLQSMQLQKSMSRQLCFDELCDPLPVEMTQALSQRLYYREFSVLV